MVELIKDASNLIFTKNPTRRVFSNPVTYMKCSSSNAQNTLQPRHQLMKLRIMTISINLEVLIKFGASEMICVELTAKML